MDANIVTLVLQTELQERKRREEEEKRKRRQQEQEELEWKRQIKRQMEEEEKERKRQLEEESKQDAENRRLADAANREKIRAQEAEALSPIKMQVQRGTGGLLHAHGAVLLVPPDAVGDSTLTLRRALEKEGKDFSLAHCPYSV